MNHAIRSTSEIYQSTHLDRLSENQYDTRFLKTLENAMTVLEIFDGDHLQMGISEISERVGLHKSIVFRILFTLKELGYIEQSRKNKKYRPTFKCFELGARTVNQLGFGSLIQPLIEQLAFSVDETVNIGVLDGREIVYVNKVVPKSALRIDALVGARLPAQCTALGKAILAFLPEDELEFFLTEKPLKKYTAMSKVEPEDLRKELMAIREVGYSYSDEELFEGIICIGAPIINRQRVAYAGISIAMLKNKANLSERKDELIEKILKVAQDVSQITQDLSFHRSF